MAKNIFSEKFYKQMLYKDVRNLIKITIIIISAYSNKYNSISMDFEFIKNLLPIFLWNFMRNI